LDKSDFRSFVVEHGFLDQTKAREMLFDLYLDPFERVNLAQDSRYEAVKSHLVVKLDKWMSETKDPLLNGDVPIRNDVLGAK
jgi:hypothetical protein